MRAIHGGCRIAAVARPEEGSHSLPYFLLSVRAQSSFPEGNGGTCPHSSPSPCVLAGGYCVWSRLSERCGAYIIYEPLLSARSLKLLSMSISFYCPPRIPTTKVVPHDEQRFKASSCFTGRPTTMGGAVLSSNTGNRFSPTAPRPPHHLRILNQSVLNRILLNLC